MVQNRNNRTPRKGTGDYLKKPLRKNFYEIAQENDPNKWIYTATRFEDDYNPGTNADVHTKKSNKQKRPMMMLPDTRAVLLNLVNLGYLKGQKEVDNKWGDKTERAFNLAIKDGYMDKFRKLTYKGQNSLLLKRANYLLNNTFMKQNKLSYGKSDANKVLLLALIDSGFMDANNHKGGTNADGYWGDISQAAYDKAQKAGYSYQNGVLSKPKLQPKKQSTKPKPEPEPELESGWGKLWSNFKKAFINSGQIAEPYASAAPAILQMELENKAKYGTPTSGDLVVSILETPFRGVKHAYEAKKNGLSKAYGELQNGNMGKALLATIGGEVDGATAFFNAPGMKISPMWFGALQNGITTGYNRFARHITGDNLFTPIKGQVYDNHDFSTMFNRSAENILKLGGLDITDAVKRDVDPNTYYGDSGLIWHPLNPTANYSMFVGRTTPILEDGYVYTNDPYDTEAVKDNYYATKNNQSLSDLFRAIGGAMSAKDYEPNEGKLHTRLKFKQNKNYSYKDADGK